MHRLLMLAQARLVLVLFRAQGALEGHFIALVLLHVLAEIAARDELLAAFGALVGLFARVDALVPNQVAHLREGPAAHLADVRFNLLVNPTMMLLQR